MGFKFILRKNITLDEILKLDNKYFEQNKVVESNEESNNQSYNKEHDEQTNDKQNSKSRRNFDIKKTTPWR